MFWEALGEDEKWQELAECIDQDIDMFFLERGGLGYAEGKKICRVCPVREDCLEYAIKHNIKFGLWGGMAERERRRIQKARRSGKDG